jgi:cytochrome oxidase Cu insertion factor (SCO1/SenC/PrrC family)
MHRSSISLALVVALFFLCACSDRSEPSSIVSASDPAAHVGSGGILAQPAESPVVFGDVAPFAFTEAHGQTIRREDLLGEPWIASSIFTRCTGPCPMVTSTMKKLAARLAGSRTKLVTFSVDPEYDTPEVLEHYAHDAGADPKRWLFLTGKTDAIDAFIRASFVSPVERDARAAIGEHVSHSTRIVVVDKLGRVRGQYSGETDADVDAIVARVQFLEREAASNSKTR